MTRYMHSRLLAGSILIVSTARAADLGTAFSYQGFLENPVGTPVTDTCTLEFLLCDDEVAACVPGTNSSHPDVVVADGVFMVPDVDFGANAMNGNARWMEIKVQCSGDATQVTLSPRQELTPAPYSIRAGEGVGGPNALNVTPSGDVGIGTTTPSTRLDVNGAARTTTLEITGGLALGFPLPAWGANGSLQTDVPDGTFTAVAGASLHSVAIRTDGTLVSWGDNSYGQAIAPVGIFVAVAAGFGHNLALRNDGALVGWGYDEHGVTSDVPIGTFAAIAGGYLHSLAIRSDGTLSGWGHNTSGQTNVPSGTFTDVAAGYAHSLAIRTNGTLAAWGCGAPYDFGQCDVPAGTFIAVAAGTFHSLAVRSDGTLVGWGLNSNGQVNVPSGTFTAVAAGGYHSLAIRSDGALSGWGDNTSRQTNVPAGVFSAVAAGQDHSLAIRSEQVSKFGLLLATDSAAKPGSNTWTIYSDRRLKKDIEPLSGALDHLLQLRGVTFQWIDPASQGGITGMQMGLIADEVQRAFPQWVGRDSNGYQTLTVGGFEALTAEALRELRAEKDRALDELQKRDAAKDERIAELEARLARLEKELSANRKEGERP